MRSLYVKGHKLDSLKSFSDSKYESFHLERDGLNIKVVSDGISDRKKEIQSHKNEAGLQNILKLQAMRYGTINNAIARNEDKKVFADVSGIPDSVGEQAALVAKTNAEIEKLCNELGLTKEQLLNLTPEKYVEIKQAQAAALASANNGGTENE